MIYLYKDISYPQISKNIGKLTKMPSFYLTKKAGRGYNKLTFNRNILFIAFLAVFGQKCPKMWITVDSYPHYRNCKKISALRRFAPK